MKNQIYAIYFNYYCIFSIIQSTKRILGRISQNSATAPRPKCWQNSLLAAPLHLNVDCLATMRADYPHGGGIIT